MKAFITGISGFAGSHLAEFLLTKNYEVYGLDKHINEDNIKEFKDTIKIFNADILDKNRVKSILQEISPDEIYHLAAPSSVRNSFDLIRETHDTIFYGTYNVLESITNLSLDSKILNIGSTYQYGNFSEKDLPLKEDYSLKPLSPYGLAKTSAEMLCIQYYNSKNVNVVCTRSFNHIGPRQSPHFVCSEFAKKLAEIKKKGGSDFIEVGNLDNKRDFLDVLDAVRAYWSLLQNGKMGEIYNVCSSKAYSVKEILDKLIKIINVKVEIKVKHSKTEKDKLPILCGSFEKINRDTGWKPEIEIDQTLERIVKYWEERI